MKIGIDISQLAFPGTGVATYTENLITNLLKIDKENEYVFFYSSLRQNLPNNLKQSLSLRGKSSILSKACRSAVNLKSFCFPPIILELLWNRLHVIPIETFTGKLDIFHSSDWLEPPSKCPKVTTIHDLAIFKYPEVFMPRGGHDIIENQKRKLEWVKKEARIIIAVSESTKKDIVEILKIPEGKIKVVYEGADSAYNIQSSFVPLDGTTADKHATKGTEETKKKYNINGKYLLAVGTLEPRKNIKRVIEAYNLLLSQDSDLSLVIVGKMGWGSEIENIKNQKSKIKFLGYVPKEDLVCLYQGAEVFVYPSLYEGFGLPVLEAMASGCPVVTSSVSSLPEVVNDAGILVDPNNIDDIALGIKKALAEREILIKKGLTQAAKFSWGKTAKETLEIYKELL
jgi:glycosyltransferase involved in cell wall biosynthesis